MGKEELIKHLSLESFNPKRVYKKFLVWIIVLDIRNDKALEEKLQNSYFGTVFNILLRIKSNLKLLQQKKSGNRCLKESITSKILIILKLMERTEIMALMETIM